MNETTETLVKKLQHQAKQATKKAYAPYSKFHVGACLLTENGGIFSGSNVENASYPLGCCAERSAIYAAVSQEGAGMRIKALAVASDPGAFCSPCGGCRQVIAEFGPKSKVYIGKPDGAFEETSMEALLPKQFSLDFER